MLLAVSITNRHRRSPRSGGIILTALGYWSAREEKSNHPPPAEPTPVPPYAVEPNPQRTKSQIIVGDVPGEAVAWQQRVELLDRLTVMAGRVRGRGRGGAGAAVLEQHRKTLIASSLTRLSGTRKRALTFDQTHAMVSSTDRTETQEDD